jgi:hypothetical protein
MDWRNEVSVTADTPARVIQEILHQTLQTIAWDASGSWNCCQERVKGVHKLLRGELGL